MPRRTSTGRRSARVVTIALTACLASPAIVSAQVAADRCDYAGRYRQGDVSILNVERRSAQLVARPILWGSVQPLRVAGVDSFVVTDRADRRLAFSRDKNGCVSGVTATNLEVEGFAPRLSAAERTPIELLVAGEGAAALKQFRQSGSLSSGEMVALARRVMSRLPSRAAATRTFLAALSAGAGASADLLASLGTALIASGSRADATVSFRRALSLDSTNREARDGVRRLTERDRMAEPGWVLPFTLADLFRPPTVAERAEVRREWDFRDRSPRGAEVVVRERVMIGELSLTAVLVSHLVEGARHYGAILVPEDARPGCCAVIVDIKGVAWNYPSLDVPRGLLSPGVLGGMVRDAVIVVPSLRGEVLTLNGRSVTSEGDRTNGFDGAAEDALSLVEVALKLVPEADSTRVCAVGHSRGASAALLAGERSRRIRCVVAMAGPTDWFSAMPGGSPGWTVSDVVADGLRTRATPDKEGGQFIERFLASALAGQAGLAETRLRLLRSSPVYFADRLPATQLHYGVEDAQVPVANGHALERARGATGGTQRALQAFYYANAGHDTDRPAAFERIAAFLERELQLRRRQGARVGGF